MEKVGALQLNILYLFNDFIKYFIAVGQTSDIIFRRHQAEPQFVVLDFRNSSTEIKKNYKIGSEEWILKVRKVSLKQQTIEIVLTVELNKQSATQWIASKLVYC